MLGFIKNARFKAIIKPLHKEGVMNTEYFTQEILSIFCKLTTIPHGSKNTGEMAAFLESFAKSHCYKITLDSLGNILARKSVNPKVCFQCHYDMVCVGAAAQNLALKLVQTKRKKNGKYQTWLKAQDSSLGADNGMGMAIMMFFMQQGVDAEFLFTNDEEVGMIGAKGLEIPISSKVLINLDSEVLGEITIGCAGGFDLTYQGDFKTTQIPPNYCHYTLQSRNFVGGHSGLDINNPSPNYQNAILESAKFLQNAMNKNKTKIYVLNWKGGEKRNSIPMNSKLIIASEQKLDIESNEFFLFEELKEQQNGLLDKTNEIFLQTPNGIDFKILCDKLLGLQIGVLYSNGKLVQNSRSLSHISFANGNLELSFMCRANTKQLLEMNLSQLKTLLNKTQKPKESVKIQVSEYYEPWEKDKDIDKDVNETFYQEITTNQEIEVCQKTRAYEEISSKTQKNENYKTYSPREILQFMYFSMSKNMQTLQISKGQIPSKQNTASKTKSKQNQIMPKIVELHAGLECGILLQRFKDMGLSGITALSIGPSINAPHSINEEVWIESAGVIVAILKDFMEKL